MLEQPVKQFTGAACLPGGLVRLLELSEYLGFSDHHRIQSAGHTQHVLDRAGAGMGIKIAMQFVFPATVKSGKPVDRPGLIGSIQVAVNFSAVAGGQDSGLVDVCVPGQFGERLRQHVLAEGHFFAHLQGSSRMVETKSQKRHNPLYSITLSYSHFRI